MSDDALHFKMFYLCCVMNKGFYLNLQ